MVCNGGLGRPHLGLLPASAFRPAPSGDGHRRRVRDFEKQGLGIADAGRFGRAHGPLVVLHNGGAVMESETPLAHARGLGSAREGAEHWWHERLSSVSTLVLFVWLAVSLLRLPD